MADGFTYILAAAAAGIATYTVRKYWFQPVTIYDFQNALLYRKGRFVKNLEPGRHRINRLYDKLFVFDTRRQQLALPGQEVLSADNVNIKISFAGYYSVTDPQKALNNSSSHVYSGIGGPNPPVEYPNNYFGDIYTLAQLAVREVAGRYIMDELLEKRGAVSGEVLELLKEQTKDIGLSVESMAIRDIMLPGGLKRAYAASLEARKDAEARLEKARGEQAVLRKLANSAKMLQDNPALSEMRVLQALSEGNGNTILFNSTSNDAIAALQRKSGKD